MLKKTIIAAALAVIVSTSIFTGCNSKISLLPQKIVANAVEANKEAKAFYGESKIKVYENNNLIESSEIKEWHDNSIKNRFETVSYGNGFSENADMNIKNESIITNDGNKMIMYMKNQNKALVSTNLEIASTMGNNFEEQFMNTLNSLKDTHDIKEVGEEKINNIKTLHMTAEPKQEDSLLGKTDFWINKDTWFIVKSISESGNVRIEREYTKLDFSPNIDESLFTQEIPNNVEIKNMDEMKPEENTITLEEGAAFIGKPILYYNDNFEYNIKNIKLMKYGSEISADEVIQSYEKNNVPAFDLSVRKAVNKDNEEDVKFPGEKDIDIRGQKGISVEDVINIICWSENDVDYTLIINDPNMSIDDAKIITENMVYTK